MREFIHCFNTFKNCCRAGCFTVIQSSQKLGRKYWTVRSLIRLFARTAHTFACFALLALLMRSAALIRSLTHSRAGGKVNHLDIRLLKSFEKKNDLALSHGVLLSGISSC